MENYIIVKDENNDDIKIEIILSFNVGQFNKKYIAYTINDDGESETELVFISEIDEKTNKLKSIPFDEKQFVLESYEEVKKMILNN